MEPDDVLVPAVYVRDARLVYVVANAPRAIKVRDVSLGVQLVRTSAQAGLAKV